ncbi:hypothetical protein Ciccas_010478 [Cichlidogyrus casuarinus]|uniref:Uncharacterized protein n=1 Tax=Cichlidogyrus casuarinus TaxID=1844966 RepID=A0ABD2PW12_9PLAT
MANVSKSLALQTRVCGVALAVQASSPEAMILGSPVAVNLMNIHACRQILTSRLAGHVLDSVSERHLANDAEPRNWKLDSRVHPCRLVLNSALNPALGNHS